jgi:rhomboid family GlyGly-CTERM serine protease
VERHVQLKGTGAAWLMLALVLALCSGALYGQRMGLLAWVPTQAIEQPWRWWTAAFVHWSEVHLAANLMGLAVVAVLGRVAAVPTPMALAWLASWPLLHLALMSQPALLRYGGLSGVLHAGVAVVAVWLLARWPGRGRWAGAALLLGLALKLVLEKPWWAGPQATTGFDFAVAPQAHVSGAVCGLLCAILAVARGRSARGFRSRA